MSLEPSSKLSWFSRLKTSLKKSSDRLNQGINDIFKKKKIDAQTLEELEDLLITADIGVSASQKIIASFAKEKWEEEVDEEKIKETLALKIADLLKPYSQVLEIDQSKKPFAILMIGVNGSGKTTTLAKLAAKFKAENLTLKMVAGDTFRAAAAEQLFVWSQRLNIPLIQGESNTDAAGLIYKAVEDGQREKTDLLLIDTAGRLHTNTNLMAELQKIDRVLKKLDPTAPHKTLLVLDATIGQNAYQQVDKFREALKIDGLIVTKLDGSAKGGVVIGLVEKYHLPIYNIGIGEAIDDLQPFDPLDFACSLLGIPPIRN